MAKKNKKKASAKPAETAKPQEQETQQESQVIDIEETQGEDQEEVGELDGQGEEEENPGNLANNGDAESTAIDTIDADVGIETQANGQDLTQMKTGPIIDTSALAERDLKIEQLEQQLKQLSLDLETKDKTIVELQESQQNASVSEEAGSAETKAKSVDSDLSAEVESLKRQLEEKTEESEKYHSNYQSLLNRLSSMKSVFSKMKEAQEELEITKEKLEVEAKEKNQFAEKVSSLEIEMNNLNNECEKLSTENKKLKNSNDISNDENLIEIKKLTTSNKKMSLELKELKSETEEYLIMINEEKLVKQNLNHEINDLKALVDTKEAELAESNSKNETLLEELNSFKVKFQQSNNQFENDRIDLQAQIEKHLVEINNCKEENQKLIDETNVLKTELNEKKNLEQEIKTKQITIGKLRHEIIVLNEHLTKAMKLVKKEANSESVDKELISNLFISFLQFPRGDTKKFEVLRLIANFLNWDDLKKRQAGLIAGGGNNSANGDRSSSIVGIPNTLGGPTTPKTTESFVSLWTEFLEKESTPHTENSTNNPAAI